MEIVNMSPLGNQSFRGKSIWGEHRVSSLYLEGGFGSPNGFLLCNPVVVPLPQLPLRRLLSQD